MKMKMTAYDMKEMWCFVELETNSINHSAEVWSTVRAVLCKKDTGIDQLSILSSNRKLMRD